MAPRSHSPVSAVDLGPLGRMAANVVAVGARGRIVTAIGDFRAFLSPASGDYFMSFAVPRPPAGGADDRPAAGWAADIAALAGHFKAHDRTLRLEFFAELFPHLPAALSTAGIRRDKAAPVMVATPRSFRPAPRTGMALAPIGAGNAVGVERFMAIQGDAFGVRIESGPTGWRPILEAGLADGSMIAALGEIGGKACCAAVLMIGGGAAELAGVGTLPAFRRHGYAADLCSRLLAGYFEHAGTDAWLSADDEIAEGLYGQLGFRAIGTQLNYGSRAKGN